MKTILFLSCLLCAGCIHVPQTTITGSINGQPFSLSSPKDSKLADLEISAISRDQWGTTNFAKIRIGSLEANMNPEVITTTADGQVKLINAVGANVMDAMKAAKP